ncbi:MAG: hypothetical protein KJO07_21805 [Deltaproteobacteria bacterium]|nr:hypothetical protein [Deltaproteobacteria bacterium]
MAIFKCPICGQSNSQRELRCVSCGADFHDPDVRALMDDPSAFEGDALLDGAETLAASKFLGVHAESIDEGPAVSKLALAGAGLAVAGFLVPLAADFQNYVFPWSMQDPPPANWFPLLAVAVGMVVAFGKKLPAIARGLLLAAIGLAGLITAPGLGVFAAIGGKSLWIMYIGMVLTGASVIQRLYDPQSMEARYGLIAGSIITLAGMLIPTGPAMQLLPAEMRFFGEDEVGSVVPLLYLWERTSRAHLTFFVGIFAVLPALLVTASAAVAWIKPGVWDHTGLALRPIAWLLVLYFPLQMALGVFNLMGWDHISHVLYESTYVDAKSFTQAAMAGRAKLMLLTTCYTLWGCFGLVTAYRAMRSKVVSS